VTEKNRPLSATGYDGRMAIVRFYFDYLSPYSYLASTRLEALAARTGATVDFRPMLLPAVLKATGNQAPAMVPSRASYALADLPRWAEFYGVPFRMTPFFPLNSLPALRAAWALKTERPEVFAPFTEACFRAGWVEGLNIGDREVLAGVAGPDHRDFVIAATEAPRWKDALRKATDEALAAGVFGAPTFALESGELFFGNDRLALLEWRLTQR
jgi:2-hydroxychromene-2-carboxylate isomerase